jgi:hypothetical protein
MGYAAGLDPEAIGRLEWLRARARAIIHALFGAVSGWARKGTQHEHKGLAFAQPSAANRANRAINCK